MYAPSPRSLVWVSLFTIVVVIIINTQLPVGASFPPGIYKFTWMCSCKLSETKVGLCASIAGLYDHLHTWHVVLCRTVLSHHMQYQAT